jgi:hypothetical protein
MMMMMMMTMMMMTDVAAGAPGPAGSPDSHTTYAAARPMIDPNDPARLLLYYAGGNGPHTGQRDDFMMLATSPTNALVGLAAGGADPEAVVTTHRLPTGTEKGELEVVCTSSRPASSESAVRVDVLGGRGDVLGYGVADCASEQSDTASGPLETEHVVRATKVVWAVVGEPAAEQQPQPKASSPLAGQDDTSLQFTLSHGVTMYSFAFAAAA